MRLPKVTDCQAVVDLLIGGGVKFHELGPEQRLQVINTAIQADIADSMAALSSDVYTVSEWFRVSRTWDGLR